MAKFQVRYGSSTGDVHVNDKHFNRASQEDVVRHVLGHHLQGKNKYIAHGDINLKNDGEGGIHSGTHSYENQSKSFFIRDKDA